MVPEMPVEPQELVPFPLQEQSSTNDADGPGRNSQEGIVDVAADSSTAQEPVTIAWLHSAAVKIQANFRGHMARKQLARHRPRIIRKL